MARRGRSPKVVSGRTVTQKELAEELPEWFKGYRLSEKGWYEGYRDLLQRLPAKAATHGYLDLQDLLDIARWGGNQHGVMGRLARPDSAAWDVREKTGEACRYFHKPKWAISAVLDLEGWGLTYGSKTLMFMKPDQYCALDSNMRTGLVQVVGGIRDGDRNSIVRGYLEFLAWCKELQAIAAEPGPGPNGEWCLADVQSAVFQFCDEEGVIRAGN